MSTTHDVLDRLYPGLNVTTVNALINGKVYRRKRPLNSDKRDIVIVPLNLRDGENMVAQPGTVFVNCFAKDIDRGLPDEANLKAMADGVITQIGRMAQGNTYMHLEPVDETVYPDRDRPGWSYSSIRVRIIVE